MDIKPDCERWMWIELIGFDNEEPDYNVGAFLDNTGFIPDGLSFLIATPDFAHLHQGLKKDVAFPADHSSYAGKPYNAERARQTWTNHQLKGLVEELQGHGVPVYFSLFPVFVRTIDGTIYRSPWCDAHPELAEFTREGQPGSAISPLKRFADGSYYEDFLAQKIAALTRDYGFDGFHAADGYSSPRMPIWMCDFSDDMVGQFVEMMQVELPDQFALNMGQPTPSEDIPGRADYIWQHLRGQWCEFYARRQEQVFTKICAAIHGLGKQVCANNAWTRAPFEAYDRYGVDYRRIARAGVDRFFLETVGAGVSIGAESGFRADPRHEFNFMLAFTKACLPDVPLNCLNGTGDTTENWDILNHAPAVSEREIYTLGHMFLQDGAGFRHASSGPLVCLADGITRSQWQWLRENWQTAYERVPGRVLGGTVLWSEGALDAEISAYEAQRVLSRQRVASELQKRGAPLQVVVNSRDLSATRGCLLVPRPELLPPEELQQVLGYEHGPVVMIGRQQFDLPPADLTFAEGHGPDQLVCRVYGASRELVAPDIEPTPPTDLPEEFPNPPNYLYHLYYRPVSEAFLQACADLLIELGGVPMAVGDAPDLRLLSFEAPDHTVRLLVGNEAHIYVLARINMLRAVREVRIAGHFPGIPVEHTETFIDVRVPPRGMIVLDVDFER